MVRFHWHVEGGHSAWVPSKGIKVDEKTGVRHITLDMELAGQNETVMSLLTAPPDYLDATRVSPVGIMLGHGADAEDSWRGPLLEQLATHFAAQGHLVMRYYCPLKEQRRHRIFEKAFDVVATSPYARPVQKWVFLGYDNGARIAAGVGSKPTSRNLSGFAFLSYPLLDPAPPPPKQKAGAVPPTDSVGPLAKLNEAGRPILFVCGEFDRLCPGSRLKETIAEVLPDVDSRVVVLEGLSGRFCVPGTKELEPETVSTVIQHVQTFLAAVQSGSLAECPLPKAADLVPSTRPLPDVPESPKRREDSPELEEPEPEPEPPARPAPQPRAARAAAGAQTAAAAAAGAAAAGGMPAGAAAAAAGVRPGVPGGMIPVMGPNGQPMLIPAAAMANNPAAQQQLMLMQQQMLAHMHKSQQQQAAAAAGGTAGNPAAMNAAAAHQQMQFQMAMMAQQMAAAQAAARPAAPAAAAPAAPAAAAGAAGVLPPQQQGQPQMVPQQAAPVQQPAPMAVDPAPMQLQ